MDLTIIIRNSYITAYLPKVGKIKKAIGTGNLFFITKKEFLPNRPGNDMANKLPDPIFLKSRSKKVEKYLASLFTFFVYNSPSIGKYFF